MSVGYILVSPSNLAVWLEELRRAEEGLRSVALYGLAEELRLRREYMAELATVAECEGATLPC